MDLFIRYFFLPLSVSVSLSLLLSSFLFELKSYSDSKPLLSCIRVFGTNELGHRTGIAVCTTALQCFTSSLSEPPFSLF